MNYEELYNHIEKKKSFLCVGLDSNPQRFPDCIKGLKDSIFEFNKRIIDATAPYCVAYKPNIAFYEAEGSNGWNQLKMTVDYIHENYPEMFIIADAKRGDIGNTAEQYARSFFETMDFDAVTLSPYMGHDTMAPFLKYKNKWVIILALTSNKSAVQFENKLLEDGCPLYKHIIKDMSDKDGHSAENTMFVAGATRPEQLGEIRQLIPNHFILVPGVGTQGGTIEEVAKYGLNKKVGLLVNSSRGIIFASNGPDFDTAAAREAHVMAEKMSKVF